MPARLEYWGIKPVIHFTQLWLRKETFQLKNDALRGAGRRRACILRRQTSRAAGKGAKRIKYRGETPQIKGIPVNNCTYQSPYLTYQGRTQQWQVQLKNVWLIKFTTGGYTSRLAWARSRRRTIAEPCTPVPGTAWRHRVTHQQRQISA